MSWNRDTQNASIVHLTLNCEGAAFSFGFTRDNPALPGYADYLASVTGIASNLPVREGVGA